MLQKSKKVFKLRISIPRSNNSVFLFIFIFWSVKKITAQTHFSAKRLFMVDRSTASKIKFKKYFCFETFVFDGQHEAMQYNDKCLQYNGLWDLNEVSVKGESKKKKGVASLTVYCLILKDGKKEKGSKKSSEEEEAKRR